jgi:tetratricopeptide (TPR) repeat protein
VLVFQNRGLSWYPRWHFAVAIGYDLSAETIRLHSGTRKARSMPLDTFERTWARTGYWGMTVTSPARLPATAGANEVLEAAVALERSGHHQAAASAFEAATGRWPERLGAWIGLANNRYRLGDLEGAAAALSQALERHPQAADAWNNLAMIRAELGNQAGAVKAARRAVELADEEGAATYRQTLWQVRHAPDGSADRAQSSH